MEPESYPVEWNGKTLHLGKLSAQVKKAFSNWLKPRLLADAREWMPMGEYQDYRDSLVDPEKEKGFWNAIPSPPVTDALCSRAGSIQLNRLLFGDSVKGWSDDAIWDMLQAKDKDPNSDYRVAFDLIWNAAHPKAPAAATSPTPPPPDGADPAATVDSSPN